MFFHDPDGNEVEVATWDCARDDTCSRFGQVSVASIRGDSIAAAPGPLDGAHRVQSMAATPLLVGMAVGAALAMLGVSSAGLIRGVRLAGMAGR